MLGSFSLLAKSHSQSRSVVRPRGVLKTRILSVAESAKFRQLWTGIGEVVKFWIGIGKRTRITLLSLSESVQRWRRNGKIVENRTGVETQSRCPRLIKFCNRYTGCTLDELGREVVWAKALARTEQLHLLVRWSNPFIVCAHKQK